MTYYAARRRPSRAPSPVVKISPEERQFLSENAEWSDFASSLYNFVLSRGGLTAKQAAAMRSMKAKCEARQAQKVEDALKTTDKLEGFDALYSAIYGAVEGGVKHPTLRIGPLTLSWARRPRNPDNKNHVYIKFHGEYRGKINPDGEFYPFNLTGNVRAECLEIMHECCLDLFAKLLAYGKETGNCAACGRVLTDENSIAKGIGPVCEKRYSHVK